MIKAANHVVEDTKQLVKGHEESCPREQLVAAIQQVAVASKTPLQDTDVASLSEAPSAPTSFSEPSPGSDYGEGSVSPAASSHDIANASNAQPLRPDVQRLLDVLPDAASITDAEDEARMLLRTVHGDLERNWRLLDELVPDELVQQLLQCCIVPQHPLKNMSLALLAHIADLMTVSSEAYRLMSNIVPEKPVLPEFLYKCESFWLCTQAVFEERFAYSLFTGIMYNETPTDFVERQRLHSLLSHCVRRLEVLARATRNKQRCTPTLVPSLLRKLHAVVGVDAIRNAKDDYSCYFQLMYMHAQDPSTRLLAAKFLGLDAAALKELVLSEEHAKELEAQMANRRAAQQAGLLPLAQYEVQQLRLRVYQASRPWACAASMAWRRGVRAWRAAVAAAAADE